jgi:hypothetical protein
MFLANQIQYRLIFSHIMNIEVSGHAARSKYTKYYKHKRASPYMELQARLHKFYKHLRGLYNNDDVYKDNVTI